jgi:hypothetical protein
MTVSVSGRALIVPLNPPMGSYREARERLVEMDRDSIKGLQRSSITIKEYRAPKGFHAVGFAVCAGTFLLLSRRDNALPGSLPYELLFKHIPQFAAFVARVRDLVLWPMIAIHLFEAYLMTKRLEKHSVPLFSTLWWMWVVSCFIEGVGSFQRYVNKGTLKPKTDTSVFLERVLLLKRKDRNRRSTDRQAQIQTVRAQTSKNYNLKYIQMKPTKA